MNLTLQTILRAYLVGYIYWLVIPLGCTAILMLHNLTGGWWGFPIKRLLEAGTRTLGLMAVLFLPILAGMWMQVLYPWNPAPAEMLDNPNYNFKMAYLTPRFFTVRAVIYFAIFLTLAYFLNKWSREQDATTDANREVVLKNKLEAISGPGLVIWGLALTFAVIDWVMSLEPKWFSTIYGMIFIIVGVLTALSFMLFNLRRHSNEEPYRDLITPQMYNDLGNLMLAFTMLWAYLNFSQYLIIYAGNIKDEIPWYMARAKGPWATIALVLIVLHFALPFLLLLQRNVKRRVERLGRVAGMMLVLSMVDVYWLIAPAYEPEHIVIGPLLLDLVFLAVIGAIWLSVFFWQVKKMPLLPLHDPRFEGELLHEHGD
jgi:membrane protein YdbS with pleckstrin-like domain